MDEHRVLTVVTVCGYFAILIFLGVWNSRKIKTSSDYMLAGRGLKFWSFVLLLMGSAASGMTILGVSGLGYTAGWPTFWEQLAVPLSCSFCLIFFGAKLSRIASNREYQTIEDYFCERYESEGSMRLLSSITVGFVSIVYLIGQFTAVGFILSWMLGLPYQWALIIGALITMSYVLLGGLRAIASIASLQVILMLIGVLIICPLIISKAPDFNSVLAKLDPNMLKAAYPQEFPPANAHSFMTPFFALSLCMLLIMGLASAPHIINNVLAVNQKKYFKWAPLIVFVAYFVMMALIKTSGFAARALAERGIIEVERADRAFIQAVEFIFRDMPFVSILAGTVVLAAVMTTTDRLMLTIGNCISWDIYKKFIHRTASDQLVNLINRATVFVTTVLAVVVALYPPKLLAFLIWAAVGVMFSAFTVPLLGGLYWKRGTREGCITAMAAGFISALVFAAMGKGLFPGINPVPMPVHFSLFSFGVSLVSYVLVSLATKKPNDKVLEITETGLFIEQKTCKYHSGTNESKQQAEAI
ncbi:Propionate transporter [Anaerohalosphaera lusitana]|uniref:Propionate transporter n=1 Tax=Anaerohalosphaera lusitana TaxID=1936003 RepID=A0A1U9NKM2_9BACT|nr:sodium:solute symporter family protein [Anaerohalosphaera lusitana]AQT68284.1 Propionate transporter [Anaerohalosphaera lusitana]